MQCEYCNKTHNGLYGSGRFCRAKCARGFSTFTKRQEINKKVRKKLRHKRNHCKVCNKELGLGSITSYCNKHSGRSKRWSKNLSSALKGKTGGYRTKSGRSKIHGGYYNGVWMDSSWEIAFAKRLDKLKIDWKRGKNIVLNYIDKEGILRKYYPDFYLTDYDLYIEIKGYWTDACRKKMDLVKEFNKNIVILELNSLEEINSYMPE